MEAMRKGWRWSGRKQPKQTAPEGGWGRKPRRKQAAHTKVTMYKSAWDGGGIGAIKDNNIKTRGGTFKCGRGDEEEESDGGNLG
jgi:hypothetical protein